MENQNIVKIKKLSGKLKKFSTAMIYLTPIAIIFYWLAYNILPDNIKFSYEYVATPNKMLPLSVRLSTIFITMIPGVIFIFANKILIGLSNLYEAGEYFTSKNVLCFKKLGKIVIAWAFIDIIIRTLLTLVITLINPPGQRMLSIGIGSFQFSSLMIGAIIVLISNVMDEARIMKEEQEYTV